VEMGHKLHAIQADEKPFDTGMYQKGFGSILYAALGTQPDITYAVLVQSRRSQSQSKIRNTLL
jgi:hypothetical protein